MAINPSAPLNLKALEEHLGRSADLFRNKISNQKDYVLALLFFKYASDHHREEFARALKGEFPGVPEAEAVAIIQANPKAYHSIIIPEGHFWEDVRNADKDELGKALNDALIAVSAANPKQLAGVFEHTDFNNKTALPSNDLVDVLNHFNELGPLISTRVTSDMLGQAYEWLIAKYAATSGRGGGEFYTPSRVGEVMARMLAPQPGERGYDPTCGSAGLLLQLLREATRLHRDDARSFSVFGQELNPETWAIARMNMLLHGSAARATIEQGDTLRNPRFEADDGGIRQFEVVTANPPFSPKNWGHERLKADGDPYDRIRHLPPKSHGEIAFVQHMVASLTKTGRMAVVLPNGVFFRGGAEQAVRRELIVGGLLQDDLKQGDLVESVIQLGPDLFYGTSIPACILVINRKKPEDRLNKVLFVNASTSFEKVGTNNTLRDEDVDRIVAAFESFTDDPEFAAVVSTATIAENNFHLGVRRYVKGSSDAVADLPALADTLNAYRAARDARETAQEQLDPVLEAIGDGVN